MNSRMQAEKLVRLLRRKKLRIVFAESCTGGELASLLSSIPGVSEQLAGSFVVYREDSKIRWLGVKASTLKKHTAVSEQTAREMHAGALKRTPEAHVAVSVTGYLGPGNADDGLVYVTYGDRHSSVTRELRILQRARMSPTLRVRRRHQLVSTILSEVIEFIREN